MSFNKKRNNTNSFLYKPPKPNSKSLHINNTAINIDDVDDDFKNLKVATRRISMMTKM